MNKPRFNIVDAVIILMVCIVIVAGVLFVGKLSGAKIVSPSQTNNATAEYTIQIQNCEEELCVQFENALSNDNIVLVTDEDSWNASLINIERKNATKITTNYKTGKSVLAEYPDTFDLSVTLKSDVLETDTEISAGGTPLLVGSLLKIKGKGFVGIGYVTNITTGPLAQ